MESVRSMSKNLLTETEVPPRGFVECSLITLGRNAWRAKRKSAREAKALAELKSLNWQSIRIQIAFITSSAYFIAARWEQWETS